MKSTNEKTDQELITAALADKNCFSEIINAMNCPFVDTFGAWGVWIRTMPMTFCRRFLSNCLSILKRLWSRFEIFFLVISHCSQRDDFFFSQEKDQAFYVKSWAPTMLKTFLIDWFDDNDFLRLSQQARRLPKWSRRSYRTIDIKISRSNYVTIWKIKVMRKSATSWKFQRAPSPTLINRGKKTLRTALTAKGLNNLWISNFLKEILAEIEAKKSRRYHIGGLVWRACLSGWLRSFLWWSPA